MIKAAYAVDLTNKTLNPTAQIDSFGTLVNFIGPITLIIGGLICLTMLLFGGFTYITSGGEQEKIQQGKRTLTFALIGLIIMVCATLFVNMLSYVLGVKSFFSK